MGTGERRAEDPARRGTPEDERSGARRSGAAGNVDPDVDPREEEGFDQPQSSAQRPAHREDDQDDVQ